MGDDRIFARGVLVCAVCLASIAGVLADEGGRSGSDLSLELGAGRPLGQDGTALGRLMWTGVLPVGGADLQGSIMYGRDDLGSVWGASLGLFRRGNLGGSALFFDGIRTAFDNTFLQARAVGELYLKRSRFDLSYAYPLTRPRPVDPADLKHEEDLRLELPPEMAGRAPHELRLKERALDRLEMAFAFAPSERSELAVGLAGTDLLATDPDDVGQARSSLVLRWKIEPSPGHVWTLADGEIDDDGNWRLVAGYAWGSARLGRRTGVRPGEHAPFPVAFPQTVVRSVGGTLVFGDNPLWNDVCPDDNVLTTVSGGIPPYTWTWVTGEPSSWMGEVEVLVRAPTTQTERSVLCGDDPNCWIVDFFVNCPDSVEQADILVTDSAGNAGVLTLETR